MSWQLHLAAQPIRSVHILTGEPAQLAVRDKRPLIQFYDLESGAQYPNLELDMDVLDRDDPLERLQGLERLKAPNGAYLPYTNFKYNDLYVSNDGQLRLIHDFGAGITLENGENATPLDMGTGVIVRLAALERSLGNIAALTEEHGLYIYQQQLLLSQIDITTPVQQVFWVGLGGRLLLVESNQLRLMDVTGKTLRERELHYTLACLTISPDGEWLLIGDSDHQVLRLYNRDLVPVRQQHIEDLLTRAHQLQLFANLPALTAPFKAIDITNDGTLAFAIGGVLCCSHIQWMTELPQPRLLI